MGYQENMDFAPFENPVSKKFLISSIVFEIFHTLTVAGFILTIFVKVM